MKKINIKYLMLLFVYISVAAIAIVFSFIDLKIIFEKGKIVGALIALSSIPHLIIFVIQGGFKNHKKIPYAVLGLAGVTLGLVCMYFKLNKRTLNTICLVWGIFDICRSGYEIFDLVPDLLQKKWLQLIELFVSIGEIIVASFLILDRFEGIKLHLFFLGVFFIIYFGKVLVDRVLENDKK